MSQHDKVSEVIRLLKQARDLIRDTQIICQRLQINGGTSERLEKVIDLINAEAAKLGN